MTSAVPVPCKDVQPKSSAVEPASKTAGKRKRVEAEETVTESVQPAKQKSKIRGRPKQKTAPKNIFSSSLVVSQEEDEELTHDEMTDDSGNDDEFDPKDWDFYRRGGKLLKPQFRNEKKQAAAMESIHSSACR